MRRGSFILLVSCATGLFLGTSYLGQSSAQASGGEAERMIETRETLTGSVVDNAREVVYALERAKDELADLIP